MGKSSKKDIGPVKKDIISELPQNIQESILGFLPLRDAVRTSILSRKWRHCWTMIPHLIFDTEFFDSLKDESSWYNDPELVAHKFVTVINRILLLHNGSILNFSLRCLNEDCDAKIICEYVDQWILLLSRKGTKQLSLEYVEHGEFLTYNLNKLDLTHLKLKSSWFSYTPYGGFPYLTNLELIEVITSEQSIFVCPVLEKLTLEDCEGIFPNNFRAPKLKCLHQLSRSITKEYSLAGLENLTEYSFALYRNAASIKPTETCNVVKILSSLQKVEKFSVEQDFMLAEYHIEGDLGNYCIEDSEDGTIDYLEIVTFTNFKGLVTELELVKYLLARSPLLKTMSIHYSEAVEKDVALTLGEEMLQYFTASSRAQIRYLEHPVYFEDFPAYL